MLISVEPLDGVAFLAYPEAIQFLLSELKDRNICTGKPQMYGDLCYFSRNQLTASPESSEFIIPYWARTTMLEPKLIKFESIGDAARALKDMQRNWAGYQYQQFRRAQLIQEKLPYINTKLKQWPFKVPQSPMGLYTLTDANTMIASGATSSPFPAGAITLIEDHENPPSRAYLKVQEALVRFCSAFGVDFPGPESRCFDAGACPGGWTWALRQLGCTVFAVDRAPLCDELMADPAVTFLKHDAFTLPPEEIGPFDFVFSDVICYPERLYEWVNLWLESGKTRNMICTIKMQGGINWPLVEKFAAIPDSKVVHLCYNKHELTWMHCGELSHESD